MSFKRLSIALVSFAFGACSVDESIERDKEREVELSLSDRLSSNLMPGEELINPATVPPEAAVLASRCFDDAVIFEKVWKVYETWGTHNLLNVDGYDVADLKNSLRLHIKAPALESLCDELRTEGPNSARMILDQLKDLDPFLKFQRALWRVRDLYVFTPGCLDRTDVTIDELAYWARQNLTRDELYIRICIFSEEARRKNIVRAYTKCNQPAPSEAQILQCLAKPITAPMLVNGHFNGNAEPCADCAQLAFAPAPGEALPTGAAVVRSVYSDFFD